MFKSKKFVKTGVTYILLEVLNKGLPFLLLPIFTRYLTTEEYGHLSMFFVVTNALIIFVGLGSSGALNVWYFKLTSIELSIFIGNVFLVLFGTLVMNLLLTFCISFYYSIGGLSILWILLSVLLAFSKCINTIYLSMLRMRQDSSSFAVFQFIVTLSDAILTIVGIVFFALGWEFRALIMLLISFIGSLFCLGLMIRNKTVSFSYNMGYLLDILKFGIPLVPHQFGTWIRTGGDRYLISILVSAAAVGVYSANYQLGFGLAVVMLAFNQAYQPIVYKELSQKLSGQKKKDIVKRTYLIFASIIIISIVISVLLPKVVPMIFGEEEYLKGVAVLAPLALASGFQGMYLIVVLFILYSKRTGVLSIISMLIAALHFGLAYYLISDYGIIGASWASLCSYCLAFFLTWYVSNKIFPLPWNPIKLFYGK